MADAMIEYLRRDMTCEGLLECIHGLTALDRAVFATLAGAGEPLTVDAVAERVGRERSTAYRSIQRLHDAGFLGKEQVNYDGGGYYHVYGPVDPDEIAADMQRTVDAWHEKMEGLIEEFRREYGERVDAAVAAGS